MNRLESFESKKEYCTFPLAFNFLYNKNLKPFYEIYFFNFLPDISETDGFCGIGEMYELESDIFSFSSFKVVAVVHVADDVGFDAFNFLTDFLRRHPMTVDVMTETTMMQRKEMKSKPEVLVNVTQMEGHSPDVD